MKPYGAKPGTESEALGGQAEQIAEQYVSACHPDQHRVHAKWRGLYVFYMKGFEPREVYGVFLLDLFCKM